MNKLTIKGKTWGGHAYRITLYIVTDFKPLIVVYNIYYVFDQFTCVVLTQFSVW